MLRRKKDGSLKLKGRANSAAKSYLSAHTRMQRVMLPCAVGALLLAYAVPAAVRAVLPESFARRVALLDRHGPTMAATGYVRHGGPEVLRYYAKPPPPKGEGEKIFFSYGLAVPRRTFHR